MDKNLSGISILLSKCLHDPVMIKKNRKPYENVLLKQKNQKRFLKGIKEKNVRFYFAFISILNLFDCIFTYIALKNNITTEANPVMAFIWNLHPLLFVSLKILLSVILVFLAVKFKTKQKRAMQWKRVLQLTSIAYIFVFFTHITWIILYFHLQISYA